MPLSERSLTSLSLEQYSTIQEADITVVDYLPFVYVSGIPAFTVLLLHDMHARLGS